MGKRTGMRVEVIPESDEGDIDLSAAESLIQELSPVLIAITHVPTSSGDALLSAWLRVCWTTAAKCHVRVPGRVSAGQQQPSATSGCLAVCLLDNSSQVPRPDASQLTVLLICGSAAWLPA